MSQYGQLPQVDIGHPPPCGPGEQEVFGMCYPIIGLPGTGGGNGGSGGTTTELPTGHVIVQKTEIDALEKKVDDLEKQRMWTIPVAAVGGAVVGGLFAWMMR